MLLWFACSTPDPTAHLDIHSIDRAANHLSAGDLAGRRRWLDRYLVVGTRPQGESASIVYAVSLLPDEQGIAALRGLLRGRFARPSASELIRVHGEPGCQVVYDAWWAADGPFNEVLAQELVFGTRDGRCHEGDLSATPRGRAAIAKYGGSPTPEAP